MYFVLCWRADMVVSNQLNIEQMVNKIVFRYDGLVHHIMGLEKDGFEKLVLICG